MISKYFKREEFKCKGRTCGCDFDAVDTDLQEALIKLREHFNSPVTINSACRCSVHNKEVGGATHSEHLYGKAADITVKNISPEIVFKFLDGFYYDKYGVGSYANFTHIDVRSIKTRWSK